MNKCEYCRKCKPVYSASGRTYAYICTDPSAFMGHNRLSRVTEVIYRSTDDHRKATSACGVEGNLFQPVMFYKLRLFGKKLFKKLSHRTVYRVYKRNNNV